MITRLPQFLAIMLGGLAVFPAFAAAQSPDELKRIEESLSRERQKEKSLARDARKTSAEILLLRQKSIAIASRAAANEETLLQLSAQQAKMSEQLGAITKNLTARRDQLTAVLTALQRIAANPPIALVALPQRPLDSVRSALLLRDTVPAIEGRARLLRDDIRALTEIGMSLADAWERMKARTSELETQRETLMRLLKQKAEAAEQMLAARAQTRERTKALSDRAKSLRDLMERLSREREARKIDQAQKARATPRKTRNPSRNRAALPRRGMPAAGRIIAPFGRSSENGQPAEGVSLRTVPGAVVVAPRAGQVVFSGHFRGLGELLIIEYGDEYHLLLAGLGDINARNGEKVLAGEPVGTMNPSEDANPNLYVELRRNGKPVNPLPWLASRRR